MSATADMVKTLWLTRLYTLGVGIQKFSRSSTIILLNWHGIKILYKWTGLFISIDEGCSLSSTE